MIASCGPCRAAAIDGSIVPGRAKKYPGIASGAELLRFELTVGILVYV